jgi:hypothetical protein
MTEGGTMLEVTTESGRTYHLDVERGFWRRLPKKPGEYSGNWNRIWALRRGVEFNHPHKSAKLTWEDGPPEVGMFMHVSSRDEFWTTTEVVSVEEIPDTFTD